MRYAIERLESRVLMAAGAFDTTFNGTGIANFLISAGAIQTTDIATEPDGSAIIVGNTTVGNENFVLLRVQPNGQLDPNFGLGGIVIDDVGNGWNDIAKAVTIQTDGKILVAGYTQGYTQSGLFNRDMIVARYNPNGTRDSTFGNVAAGIGLVDLTLPGAPVYALDQANAVIEQNNGDIVLGGSTTQLNANGSFTLVRLSPTGQFDRSFGGVGAVVTPFLANDAETINALALQPDGKIVAVGSTQYVDGNGIEQSRFAVARYNSNGMLDPNFGDPGLGGGKLINTFGGTFANGTADAATAVQIQPDGGIVIGGIAASINYSTLTLQSNFGLGRLLPDGTPDPSFAANGSTIINLGLLSAVNKIAIEPDGKIVAGGRTAQTLTDISNNNYGIAVVRTLSNGLLDRTFGNGGAVLFNPDFSAPMTFAVATDSSSGTVNLLDPSQIFTPQDTSGLGQQFNSFLGAAQGLVGTVPGGNILVVTATGSDVNVARLIGTSVDNPPSATLLAVNDITTAVSSISFQVRYVDDFAVSFASINSADVVVLAPDGSTRSVALSNVSGSGDALSLTATYVLAILNGAFGPGDNGTYTVVMKAGQVLDNANQPVPAGNLGTFKINIPAVTTTDQPPTASLVPAAPLTTPGMSSFNFDVIYHDDHAVSWSSIHADNIQVYASDGSARQVTLVSLNTSTDAPTIDATYSISPPIGNFDASDNDTYTVILSVASPVLDNAGHPVVTGALDVLGTLTVALPHGPDLIDTVSLSRTSNVIGGSTGTAIIRVTNQGNEPAVGQTAIRLLLSTDQVINTGDVDLESVGLKLNLRPNASTTLRAVFTYPTGISDGSYYVLAQVDPAAAISEIDKTNNVASTAGTIGVSGPVISLVTSFPLLRSGARVVGGAPGVASVSILNQGNVTAHGTADILLYTSADQNLDANDLNFLTLPAQPVVLQPGAKHTYTIRFKFPASVPADDYYILAQVSTDGSLANSNAANNVAVSSAPVNIAPPFVLLSGLAPLLATSAAGAKPGQAVIATVSLQNTGNVSVSGATDVSLLASSDGTAAGAVPLLSAGRLAIALRPSQLRIYRFRLVLPASLAAGDYFLLAQLNAGGGLPDSDFASALLTSAVAFTVT